MDRTAYVSGTLGSLNSVGGVAAEMNGIEFVSPRSGYPHPTSSWGTVRWPSLARRPAY